MSVSSEIKDVFKEAGSTTFTLLKIMIPISILVKILAHYGLVEVIGDYLTPVMGVVGLPGEFGLVWATAMITNIYGAMVVFFNLSLVNTYTVAQVTIVACMILVAHTLPIEARIAQKAGVKLWFTLLFRISLAFTFGLILSVIFSTFGWLESENKILWQPGVVNPTLTEWVFGELRNYLMIFSIILCLLLIIRLLKNIGVIEKLNNFMKPGLRAMGMSKDAAPIAIIGTTLGISYGGGLIIKEAKSKTLSKKDVFYSLSLMGLTHSIFEDTILMLAIGASIFGVLFARVIFTIVIMLILIRVINYISKKTFEKYFVN